MELPQYTVRPCTMRILIPKLIILVVLCGLFYAGIILNLLLLKVDAPLLLHIIIIIILLIMMGVQSIITINKAKEYEYKFYSNRIDAFYEHIRSILYVNILEVRIKRNIFDFLTGTSSVRLSKDFSVLHIKNGAEVAKYINQLRESQYYATQS